MRILHIIPLVDEQNSYGGPVSVAIGHATELIRRGNEVTIVGGWMGAGRPPTELEGVPARLFPMRRLVPGPRFAGLISPGMLLWLARVAGSYDLAHVHLSRDLNQLTSVLILRNHPIALVAQTHGMVLPDRRLSVRVVDRLVTRKALRACHIRYALTSHEAGQVSEVVGACPMKLLKNGVRIVDRVVRAPREVPEVLFMARLHPGKGVMVFARVAALIKEMRVPAKFVVVGADAGELPALLDYRREHELEAVLIYEGPLSHADAIRRLAKADIFVLPSMRDAYPMSVLEALGAGVPSICTSNSGVSDILREDEAALVCPPVAEAVAQALLGLLNDEQQRQGLSRRAVSTARRRFSIESVVDELESGYLEAKHGAYRIA